ncbi:hypothetical protein KCP69_12400 [Salmonella enterica subsp. enterica]|nr:hypothetical protein KCP69_12400 [Salmonella enterica subsp. enterica]
MRLLSRCGATVGPGVQHTQHLAIGDADTISRIIIDIAIAAAGQRIVCRSATYLRKKSAS